MELQYIEEKDHKLTGRCQIYVWGRQPTCGIFTQLSHLFIFCFFLSTPHIGFLCHVCRNLTLVSPQCTFLAEANKDQLESVGSPLKRASATKWISRFSFSPSSLLSLPLSLLGMHRATLCSVGAGLVRGSHQWTALLLNCLIRGQSPDVCILPPGSYYYWRLTVTIMK